MNIRAGLGEYILQTHNTNFFKIQWGLNLPNPPPLGTPVDDDDDDDSEESSLTESERTIR